MQLADKGVIVTGASRGLGAALARALARRGARVALVARDAAALEAVVAQIRGAGGEAHPIAADMGRKHDVYRVSGTAAALLGDVDALVHNAGALGPTPLPSLLDAPCEGLEEALAVNVVGPFRLGKALIGPMALRGRGLVVHISSDAAIEPYPTWGIYGATKAAFDQLSRVWATELAERGVRMFAVDPGEMDTAMHAAAMPTADRAQLARPDAIAEAVVAMMEAPGIPQGGRLHAASWGTTR